MKYNYHGKSNNNQDLIHGRIYLCKIIETDPIDPSSFPKGKIAYFKACKSGSLFAMKEYTKHGKKLGGYVLPQQVNIIGIV